MPFLTLPRELRDIIYSYTLPDRIVLFQEDWERSFGLLLASHQLRIETLDAVNQLLPRIVVVVPCVTRALFPSSLQDTFLQQRTEKLVIQIELHNSNVLEFVLEPATGRFPTLHCPKMLQYMPALQEITYEITWDTASSPSILLPSLRERMLEELKRVTIGEDTLVGWDIECHVKDTTRWKIGWSGVVILKKRYAEELKKVQFHQN